MKMLSLFSGIGAFEKALDRLEIDYELVGYCEIDKYASKSYAAIHSVDESMNIGDITKVDEKALPKDIDLVCYGFPCQDISLAGKQKGLFNEDGSQTRSGLFFEALRIIEETQPRVAIAENVKNLTSKKFSEQFKIVLDSLEAAGYVNRWAVLNSKDFGIPQNRERVFIVSIRKDIDNGMFKFPEGFPLELRLKDMLEDVVDEKYYLSEAAISKLVRWGNKIINNENPECSNTIHAGYYKMGGRDQQYIKDSVIVREATKKGYAEAYEGDSINLEQPNSKTRRGRVGKQVAQTLTTSCNQAVVEPKPIKVGNTSPSGKSQCNDVYSTEGIFPNICAGTHGNCNPSIIEPKMRIRKLTPKECFRLQDFDDEDFLKAEAVCSNTQLYKQAGNSITVSVPYYIIKALLEANIFIERENKPMELKIKEITLPEQILFNYEELKQELTEKVSMYETLVYTDENIKDAKNDRANLNKLKKALNDERIRREKEYMQPFNDFKSKINEIISIIDKPVAVIDKQVKEYEEQQKQAKMDAINELWNTIEHPQGLTLEEIFDSKWFNASTSMKSIQEAITASIGKYNSELETIRLLPEFAFEAEQIYISTLDLNKAISEAKKMAEIAKRKAEREAELARIKAEEEAKKAAEEAAGQVAFTDAETFEENVIKPAQEGFINPPVEEPKTSENGSNTTENSEKEPVTTTNENKQWIAFQALLSTEDALALKEFFNGRNIEFKAI